MERIYKYPIPVTDEFTLELPKGAKVIAFQTQYQAPHIWAIVNPEETEIVRVGFKLFGTGHPIKNINYLDYIGTTQTEGGGLIWHLFMCKF